MLTLFSQETIDNIMALYVDGLKTELGDNLKAVVLYGSCARGDHEIGSDIDVFVLVNNNDNDVIETIRRIASRLNWDYDTVMSNTICSAYKYNRFYYETLFQNIRQEGKAYYGAA